MCFEVCTRLCVLQPIQPPGAPPPHITRPAGIVTCWQDISDTSAFSSNWVCPPLPEELQHAAYKTIRRCAVLVYAGVWRWHSMRHSSTARVLLACCCCCRSYVQSVVCGFIDVSGKMVLNPSDDTVPGPGSRLVMLTRTGAAAA